MNIDLLLTFDDAIHKQHHIVGTLTDTPVNDIKTSDEFGNDLYIYGCRFSYDKDADDNITVTKVTLIYHPYTPEAVCVFHHFVTRTKIEELYGFDVDGDSVEAAEVHHVDPNNKNHELRGFEVHFCDGGQYNVINKHLMTMNHYQFDRSKLSKMFSEIITSNDILLEKIEDARYNGVIGDFKLWTDEEEFYMLHVPSGTIVGWYKFYHYGRDNFCNKDMNENDLRDFFWLLRHQMLGEADVPEIPEPATTPAVTVKEVDQSPVPKNMPEINLQFFTEIDKDAVKIQQMKHDAAKIQRNSVYGIGIPDTNANDKAEELKDLNRIFESIHQWVTNYISESKADEECDNLRMFVQKIYNINDFFPNHNGRVFYINIRLSDDYNNDYLRKVTVNLIIDDGDPRIQIEYVYYNVAEAICIRPGECIFTKKGEATPFPDDRYTGYFRAEYPEDAWEPCVADPEHNIQFQSPVMDQIYRSFFGMKTKYSLIKSEDGSNENSTD